MSTAPTSAPPADLDLHHEIPAGPLPAAARDDSSLGARQLRAALWKHWLIKKRVRGQTACELIAPLVLISVLVLGWSLSLAHIDRVPATEYTSRNVTLPPLDTFRPGTHGAICLAPEVCINISRSLGSEARSLLLAPGPLSVPSFDSYVALGDALRAAIGNSSAAWETSSLASGFGNLLRQGTVSFAPDTPAVRRLVDFLHRRHSSFARVFHKIFPTEAEAVAYAVEKSYVAWAVLVLGDGAGGEPRFDPELADDVQLTIRMNYSEVPSTRRKGNAYAVGIDNTFRKYILSGFLTLQGAVEEYVLDGYWRPNATLPAPFNVTVANRTANASVDVSPYFATSVPFPIPAYEGNPFYAAAGSTAALLWCLSMLYPMSRLVKGLVEERESKTREMMKIMGMRDWVFPVSWGITYAIVFFIITVLETAFMTSSLLKHSDKSIVFLFFLLFVASTLTLAFLISVFFSKAKLAGIVAPLLFFGMLQPRYAFFNTADDEAVGAKMFVSLLFAPTAFAFGSDTLLQQEGVNRGVQWSNVGDGAYSFQAVLTLLFIDTILYAVLAWYFSHVVPDEYGTVDKPYFCCTRRFWRGLGFCRSRTQRRAVPYGFDADPEAPRVADDASFDADAEEFDDEWDPAADDEHECCFGASRSARAMAKQATGANAGAGAAHGGVAIHPPDDCIEPVAMALAGRETIAVKGLRKVFPAAGRDGGTTVAVAGLHMNMYPGQITALLGHNGSGKTTTISMITGLIAPTAGDCAVHGRSAVRSQASIRQSLGVCPQHDVLFDQLSVHEHLVLYATLKGVPRAEVEAAAHHAAVDVGLGDKRNAFASALSGGMRRRLSVAIALIGGSRVIFLDEPTSGVDPAARHDLWEVLRRHKEHRTIVLTTHFMDEADALGDRIAIMSRGRLKCIGSSLFLKSRYGVGYSLTVVRDADGRPRDKRVEVDADADPIAAIVRRHVPAAEVTSAVAGELSLRLPLAATPAFAALFRELDARKEELHVAGYGASMTTLEEVFLRIAHEDELLADAEPADAEELARLDDLAVAASSSGALVRVASPAGAVNSGPTSSGPRLPAHLAAAPPAAAPPAHSSSSSSDDEEGKGARGTGLPKSNSKPFLASSRGGGAIASVADSDDEAMGFDFARHGRHESFARQYRSLVAKRLTVARRDLKGLFFQVVLPVVVVAIVLLILRLNVDPAGPAMRLRAQMFTGRNVIPGMRDHFTETSRTEVVIGDGAAAGFPAATLAELNTSSAYILAHATAPGARSSSDVSSYLLRTDKRHAAPRYGAIVINDTYFVHVNATFSDRTPYRTISVPMRSPVTVLHNTSSFHALPTFVNELTQARWRALLRNESRARGVDAGAYTLVNHPLPLTRQGELRVQAILSLLAAVFVLVPFCYLPASFVIFIVRERSSKAKHQQLVSGARPLAYWLATFTWDVINYLVVVIAVMFVFLAYGNAEFVGTVAMVAGTFTLLVFYGLAVLPLSYCLSFGFDNSTSAQIAIASFHFLTGFVLKMADFVLGQVESTEAVNASLRTYLYRMFPPFNLGEGLVALSTVGYEATISGRRQSPFANHVIGENLWWLGLEVFVFFALAMALEADVLRISRAIEWWRTRGHADRRPAAAAAAVAAAGGVALQRQLSARTVAALSEEAEDEDVAAERVRVESAPPPSAAGGSAGDMLRIQHLRKVYPPKASASAKNKDAAPSASEKGDRVATTSTPLVAVEDLSLGVPAGQCFVFLGVNGAGKTTTMSMLTGDIEPTRGDAWIVGRSVVDDMDGCRKVLGYCPQFDPLIDLMTAREHFEMYARLRGIPERFVPRVAQGLIRQLGLVPHADKPTGGYSGGNKRKTALGIALVGDPSVVFLDEPSTGMDPGARRFMWNVISAVSQQRGMTVVLTTHSMEEAEALCARIAIMARGRLRCIGSLQHLKNRFGRGYELQINASVKATEAEVDALCAFVLDRVPHAELLERVHSSLKFRVPTAASLAADAAAAVGGGAARAAPPTDSREHVGLGDLFSIIESERARLGIVDYAITQSTLEQIFLAIAKQGAVDE